MPKYIKPFCWPCQENMITIDEDVTPVPRTEPLSERTRKRYIRENNNRIAAGLVPLHDILYTMVIRSRIWQCPICLEQIKLGPNGPSLSRGEYKYFPPSERTPGRDLKYKYSNKLFTRKGYNK